jgi:hypothetical protein
MIVSKEKTKSCLGGISRRTLRRPRVRSHSAVGGRRRIDSDHRDQHARRYSERRNLGNAMRRVSSQYFLECALVHENKITDSDHAPAYDNSTFAQLCLYRDIW